MKVKKIFGILLSIMLVAVMLLTSACGESSSSNSNSNQSVSGSDSKNSQTSSQSSASVSIERPSNTDSFDYSVSQSQSTPEKEEPSTEALSTYEELATVYNLVSLDGSYNGTDASRGFPMPVARTNSTFTTYPVGYGEGTTGGRGATAENIYECSTGLEILSALDSIKTKQQTDADLKSIIKITGQITQENTTAPDATLVYQIVPNSVNNITFIGTSSASVLYGVGINFKSCNNIIVQNLTIHHPSYKLLNEKDCLEFNSCNNVWVDHCELYNDAPTSSGEKDYYDGLIDVKNESSLVTISYNYLHDAWKTSLVGSGTSDIYEGRTITYHHNIFRNLNSRVPAIRSGYGHIYNNYYDTIKSSGANCRIEADVYIENNIFENAKNPICANEDSVIGFYNMKDNVFTNCSGVPSSSTTSFTPSYRYILDDTANLKSYLDATVGVNKIDVAVQCADDPGYDLTYEIDQNLLIERAITELPTIALNNDCAQRLGYLAKEILFGDGEMIEEISNLSTLLNAVNTYISLYATDLSSRISAINFDSNFAKNATDFIKAKEEYNQATTHLQSLVTSSSKLSDLQSAYDETFVSKFNAQVDGLKNATASDMSNIEMLIALYELQESSVKSNLKYSDLQEAYILSRANIVADNFETLIASLPSASSYNYSHSASIISAINAYNSLTVKQLECVDSQKLNAFESLYASILGDAREMDVSKITEKKVSTESAVAGGVNLSKNMEVISTTVSYGGVSYNKCAYISGYGNRGTKSIWFAIYGNSSVEVVLNGVAGACKFIVADTNNNVIQTVAVDDANVTKLTITDLEIGEYRFYTAPADETYTETKAYVYSFRVIPN